MVGPQPDTSQLQQHAVIQAVQDAPLSRYNLRLIIASILRTLDHDNVCPSKQGIPSGRKSMLRDLVLRNRSYRRFRQDVPVDLATLMELVDLARCSGSSGNHQPLKYVLSSESGRNSLIFPFLRWASYLKDWAGPAEGERPAAYVIILGDRRIREAFGCDHGIAAQSMLLGATEKGLGGCMIASIDRNGLRDAMGIPDHCEILLVLALGTPAEVVMLETLSPGGDIKYWRDARGVHHVPKRSLEEVILDL